MTSLDITSTLTDRYQTTIPEAVRHALGLQKRDRLQYRVENGQVIISRADEEKDPALAPFLALLENDIQDHPEHLQALDRDLHTRLKELTADIEIDLNAPLDPDDE
ncbi:type II toxin-antitoxin system PrlF family antitoxin [Deinococcus antarcticus]|uniref:Type II toxin-antitoxin system PrlF family antitoxin n=1 Tax=Deinococcus antarcticus TaxID=1298767 RepID=A0ABV8AEE9_9DEIO